MPARPLAALCLAAVMLAGCASKTTPLKVQAEALVDRARWTVETFRTNQEPYLKEFQNQLKTAWGVVVLPGVLRGGFIVAAEGGNGVMLARNDSGEWSPPAFYTLGGGSVGLQAGAMAAEMVLVARSRKAAEALIDHQGTLGANLEVAGGPIGMGVEASTTAAMGADVLLFSRSAGAFGGGAIKGAVLARRTDMNEAYYGGGANPRAILIERRFRNPQADPLVQALETR